MTRVAAIGAAADADAVVIIEKSYYNIIAWWMRYTMHLQSRFVPIRVAAVIDTCTEGRCFGACVICCCSIAFYHSIGCNLPTIHDYFKQTSRCIDRTTYSKLSFVKTDHRGINI